MKGLDHKEGQIILGIDFDRVLHDIDNPLKGRRMGGPIPGAKEAMDELLEQGHKLVIFTIRAINPANTDHIAKWLDFYDIPYHQITATKPPGIIIDDQAIGFTNWPDVLEHLSDILEV